MSHWRDHGPLPCKVYVGNLGSGAAKHELERAFETYGPLINVWVARNPPGFAYVEFQDPRDAQDAVRGLDGRRVCGCRVRVEMAKGRYDGRSGGRSGGYRGAPPPSRYRYSGGSTRSSPLTLTTNNTNQQQHHHWACPVCLTAGAVTANAAATNTWACFSDRVYGQPNHPTHRPTWEGARFWSQSHPSPNWSINTGIATQRSVVVCKILASMQSCGGDTVLHPEGIVTAGLEAVA
ncbi:RNA-binding protein 1-like isoform X2 [Acanthaster planci]|uniref:RNA-binding protein 1-like isoform X2 n=1 Tax=Acanthaster planci TaxID=133434 RepID=A0A8B7XUR8_ACAPL|nr:RNA-binding protein 1-like isoform X2 [Acanthaster planci]